MILYLMTHRGTGLKYLGFTTQDLDKYNGSGTHWVRHVAKHGNNIDKKILLESDSEEEINHAALYLSEVYNVVDSDLFANLCVERGVEHTTLGIKRSAEARANMSAAQKGKKATTKTRSKMSAVHKRESNVRFKAPVVIIHMPSGVAIGTYTGAEEIKAAGFYPSVPHAVASGKKKSFGRTLPDGTKEPAIYTAMYAA